MILVTDQVKRLFDDLEPMHFSGEQETCMSHLLPSLQLQLTTGLVSDFNCLFF